MAEKLDKRSVFKRMADTAEWAFYYGTGQTQLAFAKGLDIQAHVLGIHKGKPFSEVRREIREGGPDLEPTYPPEYTATVSMDDPLSRGLAQVGETEELIRDQMLPVSTSQPTNELDMAVTGFVDGGKEVIEIPSFDDTSRRENNIPTRSNDSVIVHEKPTSLPDPGDIGR